MIKEVESRGYLADVVVERQRAADDAAPEFCWHHDPTLPEDVASANAVVGEIVSAMLDWSATAGAAGVSGIGLWRGHTDFGDDEGDLVIEASRYSGRDVPVPDPGGHAAAALLALEKKLEACRLPAPVVADGAGAERRLVRVPRLVPKDLPIMPRWGHAFERRRLLVVRHPILSEHRLHRSLGSSSLVTAFVPEPGAAIEEVAARARGGMPFDFALLNAGVLGDALSDVVEGLREAAGETDLRIVLSGARRAHASLSGVDRLIMRSRPERLMDVLFDVIRHPSISRGMPSGGGEVPSLIGKTLLIVEDVAMNRALLQAMLAPTGATLALATNGAEAVRAVASRRTDLVLMDIQLPVIDGLEATRRIRADGETLPIIALTANARERDRAFYLGAGMDGYLAKPIRVDDLYAILRGVLPATGEEG
ncbi:MAG: response regulator [Pseudomonadota bacterium]